MSCPSGYIRRNSYKRDSFTKKDGTVVRASLVKSSCVPDKGMPGKTPKNKKVLPKPTKGGLGKYGYHNIKSLSSSERRLALLKAVKHESYPVIVRRLNLIRNYNKNNAPINKIMSSDIKWLQKEIGEKQVKKANVVVIDGRKRQLYKTKTKTFYQYRKPDGSLGRKYI